MDPDPNPYESPRSSEPTIDETTTEQARPTRFQLVGGMWLGAFMSVLLGIAFYPFGWRLYPDFSIPIVGWLLLITLSICSFACSLIGSIYAARLILRKTAGDVLGGVLCLLAGGWMPALWVPVWWVCHLAALLS